MIGLPNASLIWGLPLSNHSVHCRALTTWELAWVVLSGSQILSMSTRLFQLSKSSWVLNMVRASLIPVLPIAHMTLYLSVQFGSAQHVRQDANFVKSIAICAGSGGAVFKGVQADLFFTGELQHVSSP